MSYDPSDPGEATDLETEDPDGMLDDLNDCGKLSDWEVEFIDSMLLRRESSDDWYRFLSDKQRVCLATMWEKRCG